MLAINYIWLSDEKTPTLVNKCIKSWRKNLPSYEIVKWSKQSFIDAANSLNIENPLELDFVKEAMSVEKWAFASDYLRQWILYYFGGLYFDSDLAIKKAFAKFAKENSKENFVTFIEKHDNAYEQWAPLIDKDGNPKIDEKIPGFCLQAAAMFGQKGNLFSKTCMDYYTDKHFILSNSKYYDDVLAPDVYAICARKFGFKYLDIIQNLDNNVAKIYPSFYVSCAIDSVSKKNIAHHLCAQSWNESENFYKEHPLIINDFYRKVKGLDKIFD